MDSNDDLNSNDVLFSASLIDEDAILSGVNQQMMYFTQQVRRSCQI